MSQTAKLAHPAVHPGRAGWQEAETARLFTAVKEASAAGEPLRSVFESLANDLGRKPNSIRNYYYACLRQQPEGARRAPAFEPFTAEETHELLRQVLMARGRGMSVRACVMALSQGSHSRMLRYQNKYRTVCKNRPELIQQVCDELRQEGLPYPEHSAAQARPDPVDCADTTFCDPEDAAAARLMAQPCVHHLLEGLKELLRRAAKSEAVATPDQAMVTKCNDLQRTLDRQQVQFDLQRIAWEKDYDTCKEHLRATLTALKDCLEGRDDPTAPVTAILQAGEHFLAIQCQSTE